MRLTKNAKKVLAATLSMALVVSGVTVGTKQAKAADALKWTGSFTMGTSYEAKAIEVKTDEGSTIEIKGNDYNNFEADFKVDLSAFTDPVITVTATEASDGAVHNFAVCNANNWSPVYAGVNENNGGVPADTKTITGKLDKAVTDYVITAQGRTVSNITITDGGAATDLPAAPSATPEATATPAVTTPSTNTPSEIKWTGSFTMGASYEAKAIEVKTDEGSTIEIKGNDYNNFEADFKVDLSAFTNPVITVTATEASDGAVHNFAVCNANNWSPVYAGVNENNGGVPADTKTITGKLDKAVTDYVITAQGRTVSNITITDGGAPVQTAAPEATVTPGVTTAPAVSAAPAETTAPTAEPTPTPDVAQTPAPDNTDDPDDNTEEAEASLTVAKKTVSIKAGKSVTVKYTATNADGDAVKAKATSANKKVAKVKVSSKKAIKITVPKNVKKGKKAVVTVKAAGKTAKIKVKVK